MNSGFNLKKKDNGNTYDSDYNKDDSSERHNKGMYDPRQESM